MSFQQFKRNSFYFLSVGMDDDTLDYSLEEADCPLYLWNQKVSNILVVILCRVFTGEVYFGCFLPRFRN